VIFAADGPGQSGSHLVSGSSSESLPA